MKQRQAVTKKKALAYQSPDSAGEGRNLTEPVELTGRHREHEQAVLRAALTLKVVKPRAGRTPTSGPVVTTALETCWAVPQAPNGKIVSVYAEFDPRIPDKSALDRALNIEIPIAGHFLPLGNRLLGETVECAVSGLLRAPQPPVP